MIQLIIKAGRIIDGTGSAPLLQQAVYIEDGRIQSICPWQEAGNSNACLDMSRATLLPGFIDTHLHLTFDPANPQSYYDPQQDPVEISLRTIGNAQSALRAGVTTVGDCGAENHIIFPVREAINRRQVIGPRILAAGAPLAPAGGHGAEKIGRAASGVKGVRAAVYEQVQAGADFIKVMATSGGGEKPGESHYHLAELSALRQEAAQYGRIVAAHAHGTQGIRDCIAAGIQRIEHCTFFNGDSGFDFDPQAAQVIARQGTFVSPTNVIDYRRIQKGGGGAPRAELNQVWRSLLAHGVSFAASSDAGVPDIFYDDYALIPELMVAELGMSPMQAIQACTRTAGAALGLQDELGTLQPGKLADIVAVQGDPLQDISSLRAVLLVMRSGEILYRRGWLNE